MPWFQWFGRGARIEGKLDQLLALENKEIKMASVLDDKIAQLVTDVAAEKTVEDGVVKILTGIPAMIQAAVDAALALGATAAQLKDLTDLSANVQANTAALAAAAATVPPAA